MMGTRLGIIVAACLPLIACGDAQFDETPEASAPFSAIEGVRAVPPERVLRVEIFIAGRERRSRSSFGTQVPLKVLRGKPDIAKVTAAARTTFEEDRACSTDGRAAHIYFFLQEGPPYGYLFADLCRDSRGVVLATIFSVQSGGADAGYSNLELASLIDTWMAEGQSR